MKKIKLENADVSNISFRAINLRCPECHHLSTLDEVEKIGDKYIATNEGKLIIGFRVCPNSSCKLLFYIVYRSTMAAGKSSVEIIVSIPQERLDFDATDIPAPIVNSLEEAITCHANNCHIAGAIMVRKTLEELLKPREQEENALLTKSKT